MKRRSSSPVICPTEDGIPKRNPAGIQHEIHWRAKPFSQIFSKCRLVDYNPKFPELDDVKSESRIFDAKSHAFL